MDEVRERYNESLAKKEQVEGAKRKAEMELKKLQVGSSGVVCAYMFMYVCLYRPQQTTRAWLLKI